MTVLQRSLKRRVPALAFATLALAACGDDDGPDDGGIDAADTGTDLGDTDGDVTDDAPADAPSDADAADVPTLPDGLFIDELSGAVDVYIDEWGIPHIACQTDEDCTATLGYMHARDRFAQMDIRRRVTTGRLHQLVGSLAADTDIANRALYSTPTGEPAEGVLLANATDDTVALLEAYARGVNAWLRDVELGRNDAALPDEYNFALVNADVIPPWTPEDSLAAVLALINSLTNDSDRELALGDAYAAVPADFAADLYGPTPAVDSIIDPDFVFPKFAGPPRAALDASVFERLHAARDVLQAARDRVALANILRPFEEEPSRGSNNWVVAPSGAAGDGALLSNDPHLGLSNPSVWYYAHMDAVTDGTGTIHGAGQSFAGLPWIVIGQNENIAWGATNTFFDLSDVYVETLTEDGTGVVFNGNDVPFVEVEYTLEPFDAESQTATLLFVPHHGPVLSIDEEAGTAVSLAWTGNRVTTDGNVLTELMRAGTVEEARGAFESVTSLGQNWVVIDTAGSIGWFPYNQIPTRPWASSELPTYLPLPGDGSAEWGDPLPLEDVPQLYNPSSGFIATANNDMNGALLDGDPFNDGSTPLQVYAAPGYRHARIVDRLEEELGDHTVASMESIVGDVYSWPGAQLVPEILETADANTDSLSDGATVVVETLRAWDFQCPSGVDGTSSEDDDVTDAATLASSAGCFAFHVVLGDLFTVAFADEIAAEEAPRGASFAALARLLTDSESLERGSSWWDDVSTEDTTEDRDSQVVAALDAASEWLTGRYGEEPEGWIWGRVHTVTLRADLFDAFGVELYNNGPHVNDGGYATVDVANPRSLVGRDFTHSAGASTRFVCEAPLGGTVSCTVQLPGGNRHYRDSPNYEDLLQRWLTNVPTALAFDVDAVAQTGATALSFGATPDE